MEDLAFLRGFCVLSLAVRTVFVVVLYLAAWWGGGVGATYGLASFVVVCSLPHNVLVAVLSVLLARSSSQRRLAIGIVAWAFAVTALEIMYTIGLIPGRL